MADTEKFTFVNLRLSLLFAAEIVLNEKESRVEARTNLNSQLIRSQLFY